MKKREKFSTALGVGDDASTRTIQVMFSSLAEIYRTPRMADSPAAQAEFQKIIEAYHYLIENRPIRPDFKKKHAVVVSADVAGYCRLIATSEKPTLELLIQCKNKFFDLVADHDGRVFNTAGDAILAEFSSASDAVLCALAIQNELGRLNRGQPSGQEMLFRIGIHAGDVFVQNDDVLGEVVNLAARIQTSCRPGDVLVSKDVVAMAGSRARTHFEPYGSHQFKNIPYAVTTYLAVPAEENSASSEPTSLTNLTRKTSYLLGDLEKTVAGTSVIANQGRAPEEDTSGTTFSQKRKLEPVTPIGPKADASAHAPTFDNSMNVGALTKKAPAILLSLGFAVFFGLMIWPGTGQEGQHQKQPSRIPSKFTISVDEVLPLLGNQKQAEESLAGQEVGNRAGIETRPVDKANPNSTDGYKEINRQGEAFSTELDSVEAKYREQIEEAKQKVGRIGVDLDVRRGSAVITSILANGPLAKTGRASIDDAVIAVRNQGGAWSFTEHTEEDELFGLLAGPVGTKVEIRLLRNGSQFDVSVPRENIAELERTACDRGEGRSCSGFGTSLFFGRGLPRSVDQAMVYFKKACELRNADGCQNIAVGFRDGLGALEKSNRKALEFFTKACELGSANSCNDVSDSYKRGADGVGQSSQLANEFYEKSCGLQDEIGCTNLGLAYSRGEGVAKSLQKAAELFGRACAFKGGAGCFNLGIAYSEGEGVNRSLRHAAEFYGRACAFKSGEGCFNLAIAYSGGRGVEKSSKLANDFFKRACGLGHDEACKFGK